LSDKLGKCRTLDGKQRSWEFPHSEFGGDSSLWPKPVLIKSVK
jgi:hypothetical protein